MKTIKYFIAILLSATLLFAGEAKILRFSPPTKITDGKKKIKLRKGRTFSKHATVATGAKGWLEYRFEGKVYRIGANQTIRVSKHVNSKASGSLLDYLAKITYKNTALTEVAAVRGSEKGKRGELGVVWAGKKDDNRTANLLRSGKELFKNGDHSGALMKIEKYLNKKGNNRVEAHKYMTLSYMHQGHFQKAIDVMDEILKESGLDAKVKGQFLYNKALCYYQLRNAEHSLKSLALLEENGEGELKWDAQCLKLLNYVNQGEEIEKIKKLREDILIKCNVPKVRSTVEQIQF